MSPVPEGLVDDAMQVPGVSAWAVPKGPGIEAGHVLSARRAVAGLAKEVLGDRVLLALVGDDCPGHQVGQHARAAGDDGDGRHDYPDQGHVHAEVLGDARADPGDHAALTAAYQDLGSVSAVHLNHSNHGARVLAA